MKVRRSTFEQDLKEKEEAFLKLTGEERLCWLVKINDRFRDPNAPAKLEGSRVRVIRDPKGE